MDIKAICFDLDGVYFKPEGKISAIKNIAEKVGSIEQTEDILYRDPVTRTYHLGQISEDEYRKFVNKQFGLSLSVGEYTELWVKDYEINLDVQRVVQKTKQLGYKTCVCTNNNETRIKGLDQKFGFLDDFDVFLSSHLIGHFKPEKEIFLELIDKSGVLAEEIIYSDDNPDRLQGATDLGIKTFVYENFDQFVDELRSFGVEV